MPVAPEYRYRRLQPHQDRAIANSLSDGVSASTLAQTYGVPVRSIYRARDRALSPETQTVVYLTGSDGITWGAWFVTVPGRPPSQVGPWYPRTP